MAPGYLICMNGDYMQSKILFFDIETSPVLAWIWRTGKQYITHDQILKGMKSDIICICWKWNYEKKVHVQDWGLNAQNSSKMVKEFSKEAEKADLAIAHNGVKFDVRHINTQRLLHNQDPIAWPVIEDSLTQFRKHFYLPSNKLDYLGTVLVNSGKDRMAFQDWIDIVQYKNNKSLIKMIKYCKKDVLILERVFNKASAFFKPKVNAALITDGDRYDCPRCSSDKVQKYGKRRTLARTYQRWKCTKCGSVYVGASL